MVFVEGWAELRLVGGLMGVSFVRFGGGCGAVYGCHDLVGIMCWNL